MFGFLKAYFARRRAFEAEVAERERARVATLATSHISSVQTYIVEHLPSPPKPTFVEEVSTKRCVRGGGERKPNASRDDVRYSISAGRLPSSELRKHIIQSMQSEADIIA